MKRRFNLTVLKTQQLYETVPSVHAKAMQSSQHGLGGRGMKLTVMTAVLSFRRELLLALTHERKPIGLNWIPSPYLLCATFCQGRRQQKKYSSRAKPAHRSAQPNPPIRSGGWS
uniref:Uncharacterized protein n=1 Tax=Plectus sambesii TaxID=2011161 RepID=A0A914X0Q5_9BILA